MCFIALLNDVLVGLENADDLKPIVEKLQRAFDLLVMEVKNILRANKIDLNDVKDFVSQKLHNIRIEEEQKMAQYRKKLDEIREIAALFKDFLQKYYFISYLNYILLKDISKLTKDKSIASQFKKYEKSYVKLISTATFRDIMSKFDQNPQLIPKTPIGLPTVVLRLNKLWQDRTPFHFVKACLQGFSRYEFLLLKKLRENCITITYAVFPSVLSDVVEYFKSSAVQQKFQEMGVSVEFPSEDLDLLAISGLGANKNVRELCFDDEETVLVDMSVSLEPLVTFETQIINPGAHYNVNIEFIDIILQMRRKKNYPRRL